MSTPALDDLAATAHEYLTLCAAAVATTPGGAISRVFLSAGSPAWDCCPQLSVHVGGPAQADTQPTSPMLQPGHRASVPDVVNLVSFTATVLRCSPTQDEEGTPPPEADLTSCALQTYADVWAIWNALRHFKKEGTLFPPTQRELFIDPALSLNTGGGCAGWQIPIRVNVYGYIPIL